MGLIDRPEIVAMQEESARVRNAHGLPTQLLTEPFCVTAQRWADHMAATGTFRHGGGEEIIAWSSRGTDGAKVAFELWLGSHGHRAWVLGNSSRCGWGVARSSRGTYWVGEFTGDGSIPLPNPVPPTPALSWLELLLRILGRRIVRP